MNFVQSSNHDEKIKDLSQKLKKIKILFSEGKINEDVYLKEEKQILDSLERTFIYRNMETLLIK